MEHGLYRCTLCGAVFYFDSKIPDVHCAPGSEFVSVTITARANEYSEAGGEITGIDVHINVDG